MGTSADQPLTRPELPPVVRATSIAELLGAVPALLGFHPERSVVAVSLEGLRRRVGLTLRMDLPSPPYAQDAGSYVADVLRQRRATAALLVAYSDDPATADPVLAACADRLDLVGVEVLDAVRCDGSRYWSLRCTSPQCCPASGTAYDVTSTSTLASLVAAGVEVLADRTQLADRLAAVQGPERERMFAATAVAGRELSRCTGRPSHQRSRRLVAAGAERVKAILARALGDPGASLSDADVAQLSVWCSLVHVRDIAWGLATRDNAAALHAVWAQAARRVVPPYEPAVLALAGFTAWLKGDGASALCAVERAEQADPAYAMVSLLREVLEAAIPPTSWPLDQAAPS